jgi:signal peptidase II
MSEAASVRLAPFRSPLALACFALVAALGLVADLWLKSASWNYFVAREASGDYAMVAVDSAGSIRPVRANDDRIVVPKLLELTAVANQGAAMGLGQGRKTLFILVSFAAIGVLGYFFAHSGARHLYQVVLGLLLAGVLGNLYDRLTHGYVRDMLHIFPGLYWSDVHGNLAAVELFPWVFNLADVYLCVGVPAVLLYGLFARDEQETEKTPHEGLSGETA